MREAMLPSFYKDMIFKDKVNKLIETALLDKPTVFLTSLTISDTFKIVITLDSDYGIVLQDCVDISRYIDSNLDREEQDFSLEVVSFGVGSSLKMIRQYKKNIGRMLIVKLATHTIEAQLVAATDDNIILAWEARESKKIGKGKETVHKRQEISYSDIKEAIVTVTF